MRNRFVGHLAQAAAIVLLACGVACIGYGIFYLGVAVTPWIVMAFVFVLIAHLGGGAQWTLTTYGLNGFDFLAAALIGLAFAGWLQWISRPKQVKR